MADLSGWGRPLEKTEVMKIERSEERQRRNEEDV
jgi:hypothetical protein